MELNFIKIMAAPEAIISVGLLIPDRVEKILLVMGPGEQSKENIQNSLKAWLRPASIDNCLIIAPVAPNKTLFHQGSEKYVPNMMQVFYTSLEQEPRKMALVGLGEGVASSQKLFETYAELFLKMTNFEDFNELSDLQITNTWS